MTAILSVTPRPSIPPAAPRTVPAERDRLTEQSGLTHHLVALGFQRAGLVEVHNVVAERLIPKRLANRSAHP